MPPVAHINRVGTAVPDHEVHADFVAWARAMPTDRRAVALFDRMATRSGITRRWCALPPASGPSHFAGDGFYGAAFPSTARRMEAYAEAAPALALRAIDALGPLGEVTHLVVASCTGFIAPGIDQIIAARLGLPSTIERTLIGFMGCYAAVIALRTAHHIVRSQPEARVLVVAVELCTFHLQDTDQVEALLAMLQFGDGAAAAIVSAAPEGLAIERSFAAALPDSGKMITWTIGDAGFIMQLAGAVPGRIAEALGDAALQRIITGGEPVDAWAVHAGGRSVLDAVERALGLPGDALCHSRAVLEANGNMSSATLMFVLQKMLRGKAPVLNGVAVAFGPGLVAEGLGFRTA